MPGARYGKWVYFLAAVPPIVSIVITLLAPEPHGHWVQHLSFAGFKTAQLLLLVVLMTMLGWRTFSVPLLISLAVIGVGIALQVIGSYQVAESIWRMPGDPGFGDGYDPGHHMSAVGDLIVLAGGLAFAITAGVERRVPARVAGVAAALVFIPPPFFWPAAGVLMLVLYGLTSPSRFARASFEFAT